MQNYAAQDAKHRVSHTRGRALRVAYFLLACLPWLAVAGNSYAACSAYHGRATINEVHRQGNATRFVEVKLLDASITSATWSGWSLRLCPPSPGSCSGWISLSNATDYTPWLVIDKPYITSQNFINLSGGTSVRLRDAAGDTIDWLSIAGNTRLEDASCAPAYDGTMDSTISQTIERFPDGTGDWRDTGGGASGGDTTGDTNDEAPDGTPAPTVEVSNATVLKGETASLTLSIASAVAYDISVSYQTQDDSAVAGTDYTAASGTATITAGSTSTSIDIATAAASTSGEVSLFVYLHDPVNGSPANHFPTVTILANPLAYWRMDETGWTSSAGDVTDQSGNGYHGTAVNGPTTTDVTAAVTGSPGTCGYGVFDGNNDYVALPGFSNLTGSFTITAWIRADRIDKDQRIFADDHNNSGGYAFSLGDNANGQLRFFSRNISPVSLDSPTVIAAGTWYFVAAVHDATSKIRSIYVASVAGDPAQVVQGTYTGTWGSDSGAAGIGGENNSASGGEGSSNWRFDGNIDEVRVYNNALDAAALTIVKQSTHPCAAAGVDHFVVRHNNYGINCVLEPVSVTAMLADGVTTDTAYTGTITMDTQTGTGTWTLLSGNGVFTDATAGDGLATYQFVGADNGVASFNLDYQSGAASIDVDVYESVITDDDTEGALVFSPSGFIVTASALSNPPDLPIDQAIPVQTAATNFTLYLAAFGQTPTDPVCGIIDGYTGAKNLKFWSSYNDPATGTLAVNVNGVGVAGAEGSAAAQAVTFSSGQAQITVNYADVGNIDLWMKDDTTGNPELPGGYIGGASQPIVVRPAGFTLSNIQRSSDAFANPGAVDENGTVFVAAGSPFSVTVMAINSLGNATPNYGQESAPETVKLTPAIVAPVGGNNRPIGFNTGFGAFTNGIATGTDFNWPEVGIITLTPSVGDGDYLGGGDVTGAVTGNVGRFIPFDFGVTSNAPVFNTKCGSFTYLGQTFDYAVAPSVIITARAADGITTTQNYDNAWWKLADFTETYAHNGVISSGASLDASGAGHNAISCSGCAGSVTVDFDGNLFYTAATPETDPFTGAVDISFSIADSDGVAYAANPFAIPTIGFNTGADQRSGRGYAQDVYGTYANIGDTLLMPVGTEYYDSGAGGWLASVADSCTSYSYTQVDNGITATISPATDVTLTTGSGDLTVTLSADAGDSGGSSTITFDWDTWLSGTASASATFGIFRGDDRFLYWREAP